MIIPRLRQGHVQETPDSHQRGGVEAKSKCNRERKTLTRGSLSSGQRPRLRLPPRGPARSETQMMTKCPSFHAQDGRCAPAMSSFSGKEVRICCLPVGSPRQLPSWVSLGLDVGLCPQEEGGSPNAGGGNSTATQTIKFSVRCCHQQEVCLFQITQPQYKPQTARIFTTDLVGIFSRNSRDGNPILSANTPFSTPPDLQEQTAISEEDKCSFLPLPAFYLNNPRHQ